MHILPWFVVTTPDDCYVKQVAGTSWGICTKIGDKEYLVNFGDQEIFSSLFATKDKAQGILKNILSVFEYLRLQEGRIGGESNDPQSLPRLLWRDILPGYRVKAHKFAGDIWGLVALTPGGPHLVVFDSLSQEAGLLTYLQTEEDAQFAAAFVGLLFDPDPPSADPSEVAVGDKVPVFLPGTAPQDYPDVPKEEIEADQEEIEYIELGWLINLDRGNRRSCICSTCRGLYVQRLNAIWARYRGKYGWVPPEIQIAIDVVEAGWQIAGR